MPRSFLSSAHFITLLALAAAAPTLAGCNERSEATAPLPGRSDEILVLADGATMVARPGSRDRAMAHWIASATDEGTSFSFDKIMFVPGTSRFTHQGLGNAAVLETLLRATPDLRIILIGSSSRGDADKAVRRERAEALSEFLKGRGIAKDRIAVADRENDGAADAQLIAVARRGSWRDPLVPASN
ncbi:OmpA family protein [Sphingopyxis sp. MSC1_008]|jgi:outer membrane protein OmpA-like peptidoglycan-associated protein|uniref:hypothetical protein n=1 Tax=Sphingopyxis sp. MSC1_008 TaxID=2909265 RepID=UPI0020C08E24|nr:hypothetical protein [Sphingopyxis sp. MSC1_008]